MDVKDFYYDLPQELIAQDPLEDRSSSRLLVLDKKTGEMQHKVFKDIVNYLHPGDCLVINDTKVIPARLIGSKEGTDAHIEILLLKRRENDIWETLVKPGKKAKPGTVINFGDGLLKGTVIDVVEEGNRLIQFSYEGIFEEILDQLGQMPLPPYITHRLKDKNRYQTVYAEHEGSAAAPTAGLHFTKELLAQIEARLALIARQGRAFGIHLILATQRPDANILPGQIKNNMNIRICGRADTTLSTIIIGDGRAAEQIPHDAQGRFIMEDGTVFQAYYFSDDTISTW